METSTHSDNRIVVGDIFVRAWWLYCRGTVAQGVRLERGAPVGLLELFDIGPNVALKSCKSYALRHLKLCARDRALNLLGRDPQASSVVDLFLIEAARNILSNAKDNAAAFMAAASPTQEERESMEHWSDGMLPPRCVTQQGAPFRRAADIRRDKRRCDP